MTGCRSARAAVPAGAGWSGRGATGQSIRSRRPAVHIEPFFVEQWMNAHETTATWNIAETCVHSLTLDELLELSGDADGVLRRLRETWLGYGDIIGSPRLRAAIAALYGERIAPDTSSRPTARSAPTSSPCTRWSSRATPWSACSPPTSSSSRVPESLGARGARAAAARGGRLPAGRRTSCARSPTSAPGSSSSTTRTTRPARSSTSRCCARSWRWRASATPGCSATRSTACSSTSRARRRRLSRTCTRRA